MICQYVNFGVEAQYTTSLPYWVEGQGMLVRVIEFDYNQRSLEILLLTENQIGCTESELDSGQERPGMPQVVVQVCNLLHYMKLSSQVQN